MTKTKDFKKLHKYYKKKVEQIEGDRNTDRSPEMWRILKDHKKLKLHYKTELLNEKQLA